MAKRGRPPHPGILTEREQEVLELIRRSLTNAEIAECLGITVETTKQHVSQILSKLGVATREEAAAWSREREGRTWRRIAIVGLGAASVVATIAAVGFLASAESQTEEEDIAAARTSGSPRISAAPTTTAPTLAPTPVPTPAAPVLSAAPAGEEALW